VSQKEKIHTTCKGCKAEIEPNGCMLKRKSYVDFKTAFKPFQRPLENCMKPTTDKALKKLMKDVS